MVHTQNLEEQVRRSYKFIQKISKYLPDFIGGKLTMTSRNFSNFLITLCYSTSYQKQWRSTKNNYRISKYSIKLVLCLDGKNYLIFMLELLKSVQSRQCFSQLYCYHRLRNSRASIVILLKQQRICILEMSLFILILFRRHRRKQF